VADLGDMGSVEKEIRHVDVLIVGGGPVGTSSICALLSGTSRSISSFQDDN
jgi:predicted GTPase